MKKVFLIYILFFTFPIFAQSEISITPKKCIPKTGYYLKLNTVFDDSRCPEGVQCIWAGEVSVVIDVYKDKKFVESKTLTFNSKNKDENFKWFETYYSKKIKGIGVLPAPKDGVVVKPKKQYLKITFID
ncbi:hypothetical protein OX283_001890 [Flavobacterium sp. SUN052]|uniref:hypothetical protein n=1 Tax=Flavobacterium sp. SUN052 TaxID=3002441 RepID=UPI00237E4382|nr:hypothetical protein [Flavobacterium sp. SUN052]MEC4003394.1 hypothetical protein [Flavobacterium sp. SUN052]